MGYVEKALGDKESVIHWGRFHWLEWLITFILCFVLYGFLKALRLWTTEIVITNQRLIYKQGIISRNVEELRFSRMEEINLHQGVLGRLLGYGKVACHGTGGNAVVTRTISDPMKFRSVLQEAQQNALARPGIEFTR